MRADQRKLFFGAAGFLLLAIVWGTQFLVIKIGQQTAPPLFTVGLRFLIVAGVGQLAVWLTHSTAPTGRLKERLAFGLSQALAMGLLYWSEQHIASALAGVIVGSTPLFVVLFARVAGEKPSANGFAAVALGFLGLLLITLTPATEKLSFALIGVLAALCAAASGAGNKLLAKRLTDGMPVPIMLRDMGTIVALVALTTSMLFEPQPFMLDSTTLASALYLGFIASAGASGLYLVLLRSYRVTRVAYLQFITALVALAAGLTIGQEQLAPSMLVGAGLVVSGLVVQARAR